MLANYHPQIKVSVILCRCSKQGNCATVGIDFILKELVLSVRKEGRVKVSNDKNLVQIEPNISNEWKLVLLY